MQFDVYQNENAATRERFPYLLDVQADLLESLKSRMVVPLAPQSDFADKSLRGLMPVLEIRGKSYAAILPQMASAPSHFLKTRVGSAAGQRAEIVAALDLLFTGV